ncbi:succinyl-diaminopimelate desuccinylase [Helicobacter cinaedi]|uniref:succinyl-diaminopimelate desuccinylase n=1 Tax=Helicobacter cinaedi TaxID=213 RepID=UPI001EED1844|nr:succinyl-diaminopimelate desuccinylase [Helicobacter cinaedi]BDB66729.1 succinyl-diaminopimelate desuccinylase [Helicobacter cinaedi]
MPLSLLKDLVKLPSITPQECGIYTMIKEKFSQIQIPLLESLVIEQENNGVKNLFYLFYPKGADIGALPHLCFAGHIDVVPTGENWQYEPFSAKEVDGYIYGRGTQDMKGGVSAFVSAICQSLESQSLADCMLSILLTSDEEGDGIYGTKIMLETLQKRSLLPDCCIVAEPTSTHHTGDMIKIGRRGSINGTLIIEGKQGHVAYPQKCLNPIELLGSKLGLLAGVNLDNGNSYFEPSKLVITDIRGGMEVVNVTPQNLKIMFNVRNSPLSNEDSIRNYIEGVLDTLPYTLTLKTSSLPFITQSNTELVKSLNAVIETKVGKKAELSTSGGTSDARFFSAFGVKVVELGVPNDRIHAINERVKIDDILILHDIFIDFLAIFKKSARKFI